MSSILMIEDSPDTAFLLHKLLSGWGHVVIVATTGKEGLALALNADFDIVMTDVRLPDMDGYEVAKRLRPQINALLVGVTGYPDVKPGYFDCGLIKPVNMDRLREILDKKRC
jgi:CheY-like chemotaxis protein